MSRARLESRNDPATGPLSQQVFEQVARLYRRRWGVGLCAANPDGSVLLSAGARPWNSAAHQEVRRLAIEESLRWGEPAVEPGPHETVLWAVPILNNAKLLGGLVAGISEKQLFPRGLKSPVIDVRGACADLRRLAEQYNLTNAALLETRRLASQREQVRAQAIHQFKESRHYEIRALYMLEEPMLIASIRKGDRGEARAILNRLLVGMIHRAGRRLEVVKSFFMELVAMMVRTAVESGGDPEELLGANFASLASLSAIHDQEKLAAWLHEMLERVMDSLGRKGAHSQDVQLANALQFMTEHCTEDVSRDQVAKVACMSPAHFSRLFHSQFGHSFGDALRQMRLERAGQLLLRSEKPLKLIALETGFTDQSYLTKVFRKVHGVTPARYRREHGGAGEQS